MACSGCTRPAADQESKTYFQGKASPTLLLHPGHTLRTTEEANKTFHLLWKVEKSSRKHKKKPPPASRVQWQTGYEAKKKCWIPNNITLKKKRALLVINRHRFKFCLLVLLLYCTSLEENAASSTSQSYSNRARWKCLWKIKGQIIQMETCEDHF